MSHRLFFLCLRLALMVALLAGGLLAFAPPARAAEIVVNTTADNESDGCGSGNCTLREAIAGAVGGDTITFDLGSYPAVITLGASGQLLMDKNLTITGPGPSQLAIDGDGAYRIFYVNSGVAAALSGLTLRNGYAGAGGGGIYNEGNLTVSNVAFEENAAGDGGGIYNSAGAQLSVTSSSFAHNSADTEGGGLINWGLATVSHSLFYSNTASLHGGGIANILSDASIHNSTFADNAAGYGGGVYSYGGALIANHSTFAGNSAGSGGGGAYMDHPNDLTLNYSILANNDGGDCANHSALISGIDNLIESNSGCGTPIATEDPLLGPLADNGGPTLSFALLFGSPAIDRSLSASCSAAPANGLDQRGAARNVDGNGSSSTYECDLGAVEYHAVSENCALVTGNDLLISDVTFNISDLGLLDCIKVEEMGSANHLLSAGPGAGLGTRTGQWWHIFGEDSGGNRITSGFDLSVTLPYAGANANSRVCKYPAVLGGYGWDCDDGGQTSFSLNAVTRSGVNSFSDFTVGDIVGPTAVGLHSQVARNGASAALPALGILVLGCALLAWWRFYR